MSHPLLGQVLKAPAVVLSFPPSFSYFPPVGAGNEAIAKQLRDLEPVSLLSKQRHGVHGSASSSERRKYLGVTIKTHTGMLREQCIIVVKTTYGLTVSELFCCVHELKSTLGKGVFRSGNESPQSFNPIIASSQDATVWLRCTFAPDRCLRQLLITDYQQSVHLSLYFTP